MHHDLLRDLTTLGFDTAECLHTAHDFLCGRLKLCTNEGKMQTYRGYIYSPVVMPTFSSVDCLGLCLVEVKR